MKKINLLLTLTFLFTYANAQEIITKKNGEEVQSKILEVTQTEIKFRKYNNLDGPIYSISKKDVFMIKYENGEKDVFDDKTKVTNSIEQIKIDYRGFVNKYYIGTKEIKKQEFINILISNNKAYGDYQLGINLVTLGQVILCPSAFALGWQIGTLITYDSSMSKYYSDFLKPNTPALIISGVGFVGGFLLYFTGISKINSSINIYNDTKNTSLNLHFSPSSIGLSLNY